MKLLLDTHILLWSAAGTLPGGCADYILDELNELYFSSASIWEIVIKNNLNRADFSVEPYALYSGLLNNGYKELPVTSKHTLAVSDLPDIHKDPFDRVLIAQAATEGMKLITADSRVAEYPAPVILQNKKFPS